MRRTVRILAVVTVLSGTIGVLAPGVATAGHESKNCGIVSQGSSDYRVHSTKMRCRTARKSSVRYLRSQEPRPGFDCAPTAEGSFYCQDPPKAYWGIRL